MMEEFDMLIETLEASLKRNGDKPLTIKGLLAALKTARRNLEEERGPDQPEAWLSDIF